MKENKCFPIQWRYASKCGNEGTNRGMWLWHRRFGHFN